MTKIEYRVIVETSDNNIGYQLLRGNEETGWKDVDWRELTIDERKAFVNMFHQGYEFFNRFLTSDGSYKQPTNDKYHLDKHIWEGWTIRSFIKELAPLIETVMNGNSFKKPFTNRNELAKYCADNQPYYKKVIPEVVSYFADKYNIK